MENEKYDSALPVGPFTYKGTIMDRDLEYKGNNHGSIVEFKNKWHLFYHRHIDGSALRRVCFEELTFNGKLINEVKMSKPISNG